MFAPSAFALCRMHNHLVLLYLKGYSTQTMETTASNPVLPMTRIPAGSTVSELLQEFYRETGIVPPTAVEIENLPPWTEEEAMAFERTINEAFEQVDEAPGSL